MRSLTLRAYIPRARLAILRFATPRSHEVIVRHLSVSPSEAITEDARRRIYIDNAGNQAIFFAFFLRRAGLPVTLLVHRQERLEQFERAGRKIKLVIDGKTHEVDGVDMELVPRLEDQLIMQKAQSPLPSLLNPQGIPTTSKPSTSYRTSLDYLLRTKKPRCALYHPPQRVEQNAHPLPARHPAFENSSRPILNLMSTIRSRYSVIGMQKVAYRLRRETTVVATQAAMGLVEEVYRTVFRDPRSRPTFLIGVTTQSVWEPSLNASNSSASMDHKNTLQKLLKGERAIQASFTAAYAGFGSFSLGPLALAPNTESPRSERKRELTAQYLINTLIACTPLNASRVNQGTSLYRRLKTAVSYSVVGPLSALQECNISEIFDDDKWRQIGLDLIKEAWLVIRHDLPNGLSLQEVTEWVMRRITSSRSQNVHPALYHVLDGRVTDIENVNGWFVESGKLHNPPVHCITHQAMIDAVQAKTEKIKRQLELKALEETTKSEKNKGGPHRKGASIDDGLVEFDRVEVIRMRKEKAQKALLGNQPMPERITSPSILPLGNSKLGIR